MLATEIASAIGAHVREGRARLGMTRKDLAAKADVSVRYLNELENGAANASIGIIVRVANALDINPVKLMAVLDTSSTSQRLSDQPMREILGMADAMSLAEQRELVGVARTWLRARRRASKGVALLGLRGAGKSTLGGMLAIHYGLPLVSVTREIEKRAGMSLNDLFNLGGPDAYRAMENDVIGEVVAGDKRIVLETAGGITANSEALETIIARFKTVWLKASPEEHLSRVARQGDTRPMHGNPKALEHLKALLVSREPEYARAEVALDTTGRTIDDSFNDLRRLTAGMFDPLEPVVRKPVKST